MIRIKTLFLAGAACLISACGQEGTPTAAYDALQNGRFDKAIAIAKEQLMAAPESPIFNSILIASTLEKCAEEQCFSTADLSTKTLPVELEAIKEIKRYVQQPISIDEEGVVDLNHHVMTYVSALKSSLLDPDPIYAALQVTPEYAHLPLINKLSVSIQSALLKDDTGSAATLLHPMTRESVFPKGVRHLSAYIFGMLQGTETFANANMVALKAHKGRGVPDSLWAILPLIWQKVAMESEEERHWLSVYDEIMPTLLTFMSSGAWEETARILGILTTQDIKNNVAITTRQLALWPNDDLTWRNYISAVSSYLADTGDVSQLAIINPLNVPESARVDYNSMIFNLVPIFKAAEREELPLLKQVALQDMPTPSKVRLEKLTKAGLDAAVNRQNISLVMDYAAFQPAIAQNTRRTIVPAIMDEIKEEFRANNFSEVLKYGEFLVKRLGVELDLNAILLAEYQNVLQEESVAQSLSADSPDFLLQDKPYHLGAPFAFLTTRFAEDSEKTDNLLKNIVSGARGVYGTPTSFYRLMHLFNEKTFPKEEQEEYLRAALKTSLENDQELSALAVAGLGHKLHLKHGLSLNFIAIEALDRTESLEDEKSLWRSSPEEIKRSWEATRPAYAKLMEAIDEFDAGDKDAAALLFGQIQNAYYQGQAKPYFDHYAQTIQKIHGWYVPLDVAASHIGLLGVSPRSEEEGGVTDLTLTLFNRLGSQSLSNEKTFTTNHAELIETHVPALFKFDDNSLMPEEGAVDQLELAVSFEEAFGALTRIKMAKSKSGATLLHVYDGAEKVTFLRVSATTDLPMAPEGQFKVTSEAGGGGILPEGAQITLHTDFTDPIQLMANNQPVAGKLFPVKGRLVHPAGTQPIAIKGFYTQESKVIDLQFAYPLSGNDGRTARAVSRCQLLGRVMLCGSHPSHNNRQKYKAMSTLKLDQADWKKWQKAQEVRAKALAPKVKKEATKKAASEVTKDVSQTSE